MRNLVVTDPPRADAADAETLGGFGTATVHEALGRVGYLGPAFRPAWSGARIGGTAVTALCWPGAACAGWSSAAASETSRSSARWASRHGRRE